jgi:TPR repeat protein
MEGLHWTLLAADNGDVDALVEIGDCFWGLRKWEAAAEFYRRAAERGDSGSQVTVAHMIYEGRIRIDLDEMVHWYFLASEEEWIARFMMGECYRHGRGLRCCFDSAMRWFLKSAEESDVSRRRLEACAAFFQTSPNDYSRAFAIERGQPSGLMRSGMEKRWQELQPDELTEGLRRLTKYENHAKGEN